MKKLILSSLIVFFSTAGFAQNEIATSELTSQALELLIKNQDALKMEGNISPGEKLKSLIDDWGSFVGELQSLAVDADASSDYTGNIKNFTAECVHLTSRELTAKCQLIIQYKPLGETGIMFHVDLDSNSKPKAIQGNRVEISRGD